MSTPGSKSGRRADGIGLAAVPMTPPAAGKALSVEEKKEVMQTDHFQVRRASDDIVFPISLVPISRLMFIDRP